MPGLSATIVINVTPLTDNEVWFQNAAAWNNYWTNVSGEVTLQGATTTPYVPLQYDNTKLPCNIKIDGVDYAVVTMDQFQSLLNVVINLDQSYQLLRGQLYGGGIISQV